MKVPSLLPTGQKSLFPQSDTNRQTKEPRAWDSNFSFLIILLCWKYREVKINRKVQFLSIESPDLSWCSPVVSPLATKPSCSEGSEAVVSSPHFHFAGKLSLDSISLWVSPSWRPKGSGRLGKEITTGMSLSHFTSDRRVPWNWLGNNKQNSSD